MLISQLIKKLTKFLPLVVLFSLLALTFSLLLSQIYANYKSAEQLNGISSYDLVAGQLTTNPQIKSDPKKIIHTLTNQNAPLYLIDTQHHDSLTEKSPPIVLANFSTKLIHINLASGRWFSTQEIEEGQPVAIISKSFWAQNNQLSQLKIKNKAYTVVGVIEDYRRANLLTSPIYLNPRAFLSEDDTIYFPEIILSQQDQANYQAFVSALADQGYIFKLTSDAVITEKKQSIFEFIQASLPLFSIAVISLILVFSNYLKKTIVTIGVKKMLGWKNPTIIWHEIIPLLTAILTSVAVGLMSHRLLAQFIFSLPEVYSLPAVITLGWTFLTSLIMLSFTTIRLIHTSPLSLLRGRSL
ncbi:ABC transporter permease [Vagococcus salmoninarum]|uniref:MacB-like periplasmic core domain-containing protein n=1 Tax=Vagococcus salmoninarum TaxID=2739 RepID=A0A429ZJV2_9ENTE|nr:ABC transporter permease [Vagococcus salmoninarum]RST93962.1 hypothetical protein CBF35_10935 [Vagococcus salmoninarum]